MKKGNFINKLICVVLITLFVGGCGDSRQAYFLDSEQQTEDNSIDTNSNCQSEDWETAQAALDNINVGWNLGSSLECFKGDATEISTQSLETTWGITATTKETIDAVANQGFGMVRIPVTYTNYIDENGNIQEFWLDRVEEVVNYVLSNDMYCIINVHHDTGSKGWIFAESDCYEKNKDKIVNMWTQIAERFKDYDDRLMFEGFNEVLDYENEWTNAKESAYQVMNDYNQLFVDTVRKTGGNNEYRNLILNTYAAKAESGSVEKFVMPDDSVQNHLIVGVHIYCGYDSISWYINNLKPFLDQNIPVLIGEFGIQASDADTDNRVKYVEAFMKEASNSNITCAWWDDGYQQEGAENVYNFALLNRSSKEWYFPEIVDVLTKEY